MERSWRRYFMALLVVILILSLTNAQDYKGQGFKLTSIKSSFDVLETTSKMKTLIECCSFCLAKSPPCEGVQFDKEKTSCSSLANILPSDSGTSSAYIMVPLSSRNKAKVLLVSGNERNMELVNLATKQSFIYEFPIQWAQGGPISANVCYFCSYYEDLFCVTLNIDTLEIEPTGVTTQFQKRAVGTTIKQEGEQVIWLTGTSTSSQITSLIENKVGAGPELPVGINAHCVLRLNSTTVAVLAGFEVSPWRNNNKMWYYHVQDDQWVEGPSLKVGRRWAGCGTFEYGDSTYILVVGGTDAEAGKSVEMLNIRGNAWVDGPDFDYDGRGGSEEAMVASLTTSLEGELAWVFGGTIIGDNKLDMAWRFHCPGKPEDGGCEWIYHQNALVRRDWGTAITF